MDATPMVGGPLDGEAAENTEEQITHRHGDTVHVYERWPGDDGRERYHHAAALPIGPARIGGET
jgi:hypothetical protein